MEKDHPEPKTQPSGNQPPPRPPTRIAIGMLPDDEGPEKNRRHIRRENVRINLPPKPLAEPTIQLPMLPGAIVATSKKTLSAWPVALLLILAIWIFIGAMVTMVLYAVFSDNFNWDVTRSVDVVLLLLFLWVPFALQRSPKIQVANRPIP